MSDQSSFGKVKPDDRWGIGEAPPVPDAEALIINAGPAVFTNKMYVTTTPQGIRLTFCETNPAAQTPAFRSAVFLSFQDTASLIDLLQRQLAIVEKMIFPAEAENLGQKP